MHPTLKRAAQEYVSTLHRLARLRGVQTSYVDASGEKRNATPIALARVLSGLGSEAGTEAQALASETRLMTDLSRRRVEPVVVAWAGRRAMVGLLLSSTRGRVTWSLRLESGQVIEGAPAVDSLKVMKRRGPMGGVVSMTMLPLPPSLPMGYHRLTIGHAGEQFETTVIASPVKSFRHERGVYEREWGIFSPVYALRSSRNTGIGDLRDLRELARMSESLGGRVLATLPLLACHLGEKPGPFDPSPYAPISRLFWNEVFIDPSRTPEFESCAAAKRLMSSAAYVRESKRLHAADLVDYRAVATLKRSAMEALAERFFSTGSETSETFRAFLAEKPLAREYASFRGVTEKRGEAWSEWPAEMRRRTGDGHADTAAVRYHLYAQYAAWLELLAMGAELKASGGLMYLDLPVGVSPFGFDTWRYRGLFAPCSTGAPPDPYFTGGQNWGFPPMHPDACRVDAYGYLRECLRAHMRHADYLRLDHVMAFHRLFWIPDGMSAADGVYVRYRDEEMYAVLCVESHRNRCRLVGENLGTVPPEVNKALARHDLCGLYVAQYEMQPKTPALRPVPANCVASVNTHDMPPFATAWSAGDVDDRINLGMLDAKRRRGEIAARKKAKSSLAAFLQKKRLLKAGKNDAASVRDALLMHLASSDADFLLINLEDLWLEKEWQNVPGTMDEHPNWRRKLRLTLDEIESNKSIRSLLARIDALRRGRPQSKPRAATRRAR